jgi:hypothetical protein
MLATSTRGYGEHGKGGNTEFNLFGTIEGQLSFISMSNRRGCSIVYVYRTPVLV